MTGVKNVTKRTAGIILSSMLISLMLYSCCAVCKKSAPAAANATPATEKTTLDNLQAAFNGESNANARYMAFAKKADEEGYGQVASLFRAAARAEQVHMDRHTKIIEQLGSTPKATIEPPVVKSTKENIEAAFKGETYEYTEMYPAFLAQAEKEKVAGAVDAFEDARSAEAVHAQLYETALKNLESWKGANKDFYVCPWCGNVVDKITEKLCSICGTDTGKFIAIK